MSAADVDLDNPPDGDFDELLRVINRCVAGYQWLALGIEFVMTRYRVLLIGMVTICLLAAAMPALREATRAAPPAPDVWDGRSSLVLRDTPPEAAPGYAWQYDEATRRHVIVPADTVPPPPPANPAPRPSHVPHGPSDPYADVAAHLDGVPLRADACLRERSKTRSGGAVRWWRWEWSAVLERRFCGSSREGGARPGAFGDGDWWGGRYARLHNDAVARWTPSSSSSSSSMVDGKRGALYSMAQDHKTNMLGHARLRNVDGVLTARGEAGLGSHARAVALGVLMGMLKDRPLLVEWVRC